MVEQPSNERLPEAVIAISEAIQKIEFILRSLRGHLENITTLSEAQSQASAQIERNDACTPESLKALREQLGFSQEKMASKFNVKRRTYQDWELGNNPVTGAAVVVFRFIKEGKI